MFQTNTRLLLRHLRAPVSQSLSFTPPLPRLFSSAASAADAGNLVILTDRSADRLALLKKQQNVDKLSLRLSVEGGGCSGFQYKFETTTAEVRDLLLNACTVQLH